MHYNLNHLFLLLIWCLLPTSLFAYDIVNDVSPDDATASQLYGTAVAVGQETVIVGAPGDDNSAGAAYIQTYNRATGIWEETEKLTASNAADFDNFGEAVAITKPIETGGEFYAAVGAPQQNAGLGAVYVYQFGSQWTEAQVITAPDITPNLRFGTSIAMSDDLLLIGASGDINYGLDAGAAYLYKRSGSSWMFVDKIHATNNLGNIEATPSELFGQSVGVDGNHLIIGAPLNLNNLGQRVGAAYIFNFDATSNSISFVQKLNAQQTGGANDANNFGYFGYSVDMADGYAIIGGYGDTSAGANTGAAYIYELNGATWQIHEKLLAATSAANSYFGWSVAIEKNGDVPIAVVGAKFYNSAQGSLNVYAFDGTNWTNNSEEILASTTTAQAQLGFCVGICGAVVAAGAHQNTNNGFNSGVTQIYEMVAIPSNLVASDGTSETSVSVTWNNRSTTQNDVLLWKDEQLTPYTTNTTFNDNAVTFDETYTYCIAAEHVMWGNSQMLCDEGFILEMAAPVNIQATNTASGLTNYEDHIDVTWNNTTTATNYRLEIYKNGSLIEGLPTNPTATYANAAAAPTSYTDYDVLSPSTNYAYEYCLQIYEPIFANLYEIEIPNFGVATYLGTNVDITTNQYGDLTYHFYNEAGEIHSTYEDVTGQLVLNQFPAPSGPLTTYTFIYPNYTATIFPPETDAVVDSLNEDGNVVQVLALDANGEVIAQWNVPDREVGNAAYFNTIQATTPTEVGRAKESVQSCSNLGTIDIGAPTNVTASYASGFIDLTWTDSSALTDSFFIYRDDTYIGLATSNTFTDYAVQSGTAHLYCVTAVAYLHGESQISPTGCVEAGFNLATPTNVVASNNLEDQVDLNWTYPNLSAIQGYYVYKNGVLIADLPPFNSIFTDTEVTTGNTYNYCVAAYNIANGTSDKGCAEGIIDLADASPITASDNTFEDKVEITWTDNSTVNTHYRIYRTKVPQATNDTILIAEVLDGTISFDDTNVLSNVVYEYCVETYSTTLGADINQVCDIGSALIFSPTFTSASQGTSATQVNLAFNYAGVATNINIYRNDDLIATVPTTTTTYTDVNPPSNIQSTYCLIATQPGLGESLPACLNGWTTTTPNTPPAAVPTAIVPNQIIDDDFTSNTRSIAADEHTLIIGDGDNDQARIWVLSDGLWSFSQVISKIPLDDIKSDFTGGPEDDVDYSDDNSTFGNSVTIDGNQIAIANAGRRVTEVIYDYNTASVFPDVTFLLTEGLISFYEKDASSGLWQLVHAHQNTNFNQAEYVGVDISMSNGKLVTSYTSPLNAIRVFESTNSGWEAGTFFPGIPSLNPSIAPINSVAVNGNYLALANDASSVSFNDFPALSNPPIFSTNSASSCAINNNQDVIIGGYESGLNEYVYIQNNDGSNQVVFAGNDFLPIVNNFGKQVAVNNNHIVVSSDNHVTIFDRRSSGTWSRYETLEKQNPDARGEVAIAGKSVFFNTADGVMHYVIPPRELTATNGEFTDKIQVKWEGYTNYDEELVEGFKIYRDDDFSSPIATTANININSIDDENVEPGNIYKYCIKPYHSNWATDHPIETVCATGYARSTGQISGDVTTISQIGIPNVQICAETTGTTYSMKFDGVDDYAETANNIPLYNRSFTIEFWAKNEITGIDNILLSHDKDQTLHRHLHMGYLASGQFRFGFWGDDLDTPTAYGDEGEWHHWACVYDTISMLRTIYRDGIAVASDNPGGHYTGARKLNFGSYKDTDYGKGQLDEVRVWDYARTATEVANNYQNIIGGNEPGLIGYWNFDDPQNGNLTRDGKVGVGNHANVYNGAVRTYNTPLNLSYCAFTSIDGSYQIINLPFSDTGITYAVTPFFDSGSGPHEFNPTQQINQLTTVQSTANYVNFTDNTTFSVSGTVNYGSANNYCPVDSVAIYLDGTYTGVLTDDYGDYNIVVNNPGEHEIAAVYPDNSIPHIISNSPQTINVQNNITDIDFTDITSRSLIMSIGGACGADIGIADYEIKGGYSDCLIRTGTTAASGIAVIEHLPPGQYNVKITDIPNSFSAEYYFANLNIQVDLNEQDSTLNLIYNRPFVVEITNFDELPLTCEGDKWVFEQNETYNLNFLVYQQFPDGTQCPAENGSLFINDNISGLGSVNLPIADDGTASYTMIAGAPMIIEPYTQSLTLTAQVNGVLTPSQTVEAIITGVRPRTATFVTLVENLPDLILRDPPGDNSHSYVDAGQQRCYEKGFYYNTTDGLNLKSQIKFGIESWLGLGIIIENKATGYIGLDISTGFEHSQDNSTEYCINFNETFSTSTNPLIPGPQGDLFMGNGLNYIYALSDEVTYDGCMAQRLDPSINMLPDDFVTTYIYSRWHIENVLLPQLANDFQSAEQTIQANAANSLANWQNILAMDESIYAVFTQPFNDLGKPDTADLAAYGYVPDEGQSIGDYNAAYNEAYQDVVNTNEDRNILTGFPGGYTIDNFNNYPTSEGYSPVYLIGETTFNELPSNAIDAFEELGNFPNPVNYSFDGGVNYQYSTTVDRNWKASAQNGFFIDAQVGVGAKVEAGGSGYDQYFGAITEHHVGGTAGESSNINFTTGFEFSDDDLGDFFTVNVNKDFVYGTSVFDLRSGRTSCPWEPWIYDESDPDDRPRTQSRDLLELQLLGSDTQTGLDPSEPANFVVRLFNWNESGEFRAYALSGIPDYNPHNATIKANGAQITNSNAQYWIDAQDFLDVDVSITRGPDHYDYVNDSIALLYYVPCEYALFNDGGNLVNADTLWLKIGWTPPCNNISIIEPYEGKVINSQYLIEKQDTIEVALGGINTENLSKIDFHYVQYNPVTGAIITTSAGISPWTFINSIDTAYINADPDFDNQTGLVSIPLWYVNGLPNGYYKIRATPHCNVINSTLGAPDVTTEVAGSPQIVNIQINNNNFTLLGYTEPTDGLLEQSDPIFVRFNDDIDCGYTDVQSIVSIIDETTGTIIPDWEYTIVPELVLGQCGDQIDIVFNNGILASQYEGHLLTVTIDTLDQNLHHVQGNAGNSLQEPISWSFVVQYNSVFWNPSSYSGANEITIYGGTDTTLTAILDNTRPGNRAYDLVSGNGFAPWMSTPTPQNLALGSNGQQTISFTLNQNQNLAPGTYQDTIIANIDDNTLIDSSGDAVNDNDVNFVPDLPITLNVLPVPPNWNIPTNLNPADYQYDMTMFLQLDFDVLGYNPLNPSDDPFDMVAAYVDGELRGLANVELVNGEYIAILTVYSNDASNTEEVTFQMWDADIANGILYGGEMLNDGALTVNGNLSIGIGAANTYVQAVQFTSNAIIGSPAEPHPIHAYGRVQCFDLVQGWNWISFNVASPDMSVAAILNNLQYEQDGYELKTQNDSYIRYSSALDANGQALGWSEGDLAMVNNEEGYLLYVSNPTGDHLCVVGEPYDYANNTIDVSDAGWHWVAYTKQDPTDINTALASMTPATGDLVKTKLRPTGIESSVYDAPSSTWSPNISLKPDYGYKMYLENGSNSNIAYAVPQWSVNPQCYENSMTITGVLQIDQVESVDIQDIISASVTTGTGACNPVSATQGINYIQYIPALDRYYVFLTVYGDQISNGEIITFSAYDANVDSVYTVSNSLIFNDGDRIGSFDNPHVFIIGTCPIPVITSTEEGCSGANNGTATANAITACGLRGHDCNTPTLYQLGTSTTSNDEVSPFQSGWSDARYQFLYTAEELNTMGMHEGTLSSLAFNVLQKFSNVPFNNFNLKLKCIDDEALTPSNFESGLKTVYSGNWTTQTGWNTINFQQTYDWDGTSNLLVEVCFDNVVANYFTDKIASTATTNISTISMYDDNMVGCDFLYPLYAHNERPDITLGACNVSYVWNDANGIAIGQINATATGLAGGTYQVASTFGNGCTSTTSVVIGTTPAMTFTTNSIAVSCTDLGEAGIAVASGGTPPFTYQWDDANAQTAATATGLNTGTYYVTITDASACSAVESVVVAGIPAPYLTVTATGIDAGCIPDGQATATPVNGLAPFTYIWDDADAQTTATATNLGAGTYNVTITDNNSCIATDVVTISGSEAVAVDISTSNALCNNDNSGSASVTPTNGTAPFTYQWNDDAAQTTATATNLLAGNYEVTVTDSNGCINIQTIEITEPTALTCSGVAQNIDCNGGTNGSVTGSATGGTGVYTYTWQDANGTTLPGAFQNNLPAGAYTLEVSDDNACTCSTTTTIIQSSDMELVSVESNTNPSNISLYNTVVVEFTGGTAPYTFEWNTTDNAYYESDITSTPATIIIYYVDGATWDISVYDINGCSSSDLMLSSDNYDTENVILDIVDYTIGSDSGSENGSVSVNVTGGTAPYNYYWASSTDWDGSTINSPTISGLATGWYTVTVTDTGEPQQTTIGWYWVPNERRGRGKVELAEGIDLVVAPNPIVEQATITFSIPTTERASISLFNVNGQTQIPLQEEEFDANTSYQIPIAAQHLAKGIYICHLVTESGLQMTKKVVIH